MSDDKKPEVPVSVHEPPEAKNAALPVVVREPPEAQESFFNNSIVKMTTSFFMGREQAVGRELQKQKTEGERQGKGAESKKVYDSFVHEFNEVAEDLKRIRDTLDGNKKTVVKKVKNLLQLFVKNNKVYPEGFIHPDKATKMDTLLRSYKLLLADGQDYKAKENEVLASKKGVWCDKWYAGEMAFINEVKANLQECNRLCEELAELEEKLEPAKQTAFHDGVVAVESKLQTAARMATQNDLLDKCDWFITGKGQCARVDNLPESELLALVIAQRCKTTAQKRAFNVLAMSFNEAKSSLRAIEDADAVGGSACKKAKKAERGS